MKTSSTTLFVFIYISLLNLHIAGAQTNYQIRFGIIERDDSGNDVLSKETSVIPRKLRETGFRFGCEIVPPDQKVYTCQYIVHVPDAPDTLTGRKTQPNADKPSKVFTSPKKRVYGIFTGPMWFDSGDPVGDYNIEILINDKLQKTVRFQVILLKEK